jgi:hypothetical protein
MNQRDDDLSNALKEVRLAYRVVWAFQRKILDLCATISDKFDREFYYWYPIETDMTPMGRKDPTNDRWAWDFLPLYYFSILYLGPGNETYIPRAGDWMLEISIRADDSVDLSGNTEPNPAKFDSPEKGSSKLTLYGWFCTRTKNGNWVDDVWDKLDWPKNENILVHHKESGIKVVGKSFGLTDLISPEAVSSVVNQFKELLRNQFDLKGL